MGADFIVAMAPMRKTQDEAIAKLKAMDAEVLFGILSDYYGREFIEDTDEQEYAAAVAFVTAKIDEVYGCYKHGSRETNVHKIDGTDWLITGGMSYGDYPTDAYESVSVIALLGLTDNDEILTD